MTQHAYSVTGLARVRGPAGETPLVRLRNPSGQGEWTGAWSERSWEWDGLSARDKELLSMRVRNDGEFWYVNRIELPTIIGSIYTCLCRMRMYGYLYFTVPSIESRTEGS